MDTCSCIICEAIAQGLLRPVKIDFVCPARVAATSHIPEHPKSDRKICVVTETTPLETLSHAPIPAALESEGSAMLSHAPPKNEMKPESSSCTDDELLVPENFNEKLMRERTVQPTASPETEAVETPASRQDPTTLIFPESSNVTTDADRTPSPQIVSPRSSHSELRVGPLLRDLHGMRRESVPAYPPLFPQAEMPIRIEIPTMDSRRSTQSGKRRRRQSIRWVCCSFWISIITFSTGLTAGVSLGKISIRAYDRILRRDHR